MKVIGFPSAVMYTLASWNFSFSAITYIISDGFFETLVFLKKFLKFFQIFLYIFVPPGKPSYIIISRSYLRSTARNAGEVQPLSLRKSTVICLRPGLWYIPLI